jgi:sugar lactone lactonase YvrE
MMKRIIIILSIVLISVTMLISVSPAFGQFIENYWKTKRKAFSVSTSSECQSHLEICNEVIKINPYHPVMNYLIARLNEQLGNSKLALKYLKKAARLGYTSKARWLEIHPMNDPAFSNLRKKEAFKEIIKIMNVSDEPIHKSQIAFIVNDKTISTEGITYDPVEKMFYLGSDYEIVKVDHSGNCSVFTKEAKEDGLNWVNGIHVDPVRRTLWACSNDENREKVEIFKYNLTTGKMVKKYTVPSDGRPHMFNDLVIHPNGDIYITDIRAIYMISHVTDMLKLFLRNESYSGSNGITVSDDGQVIYAVDDIYGICKIDIKTKAIAPMTHEKDFHTYGIDGLYYADNYLYAIQAELSTKVSRFLLNEDAIHLESCEIFEKNTDDLRAPTTGVIVDDYFYFIADTQGKGSKLEGIVVMKAPLR